MQAFDFDAHVVKRYEAFSRSFSIIRAPDVLERIDSEYQDGRFWPQALLSLNPRYEAGKTTEDLLHDGVIESETARIFQMGGAPLRLHLHQEQALAKAQAGGSYVVTTGTGSGKSLCFFIPIVDAIIRARKAGAPRKTSAIVIYPMNALANSQIKEIEKFIEQADLPQELRPLVRRYTGQESRDERLAIATSPPDILLTNFMMAELLLTRQDEVDGKVIANAEGLKFLVLDELHTYRGRQGSDVAVLVRRLRERCAPEKAPLFIGTSATMATEGDEASRAAAVAAVATRIFGVAFGSDSVIDESLRRATHDALSVADVSPQLLAAVSAPLPSQLTDEELKFHPLAVWVEMALGLDDRKTLKRQLPVPFGEAVQRLSGASGAPAEVCDVALRKFLTRVSLPERLRGGFGDAAFLAFKLHRFIAGAGEIYTTLKAPPRIVLLEGQLEAPGEPGTRLYATRFCRACGQEVHVVALERRKSGEVFVPRNIDDTPVDRDDDDDEAGYLVPCGDADQDYRFDGDIESFPESWREERNGVLRLRANRKKRVPRRTLVQEDGRIGSNGRPFWFIPGKFGFCPCCLDEPQPAMRERSKLAGLSAEGRSSATTMIVSSALEWLGSPANNVPNDKRKLLGFTDNRQDAALQAGHFNDFLFVTLLRGGILRAVLDAGAQGLRDDEFGLRVARALGFEASHASRRAHWMATPEAGAVTRNEAERALHKVLAHRVWTDLRRGWRFTNPSLATLDLVSVDFLGIDEIAADAQRLGAVLPAFLDVGQDDRRETLRLMLEAMLEGLAVDSEALDPAILDGVALSSRNTLRTPWSIDRGEQLRQRAVLLLRAPGKAEVGLKGEKMLMRGGQGSRIARLINRPDRIGAKLGRDDYAAFMGTLLDLLVDEGILRHAFFDDEARGWRISPAGVRLVAGASAGQAGATGNPYFHALYSRIADDLQSDGPFLFGLEAREHTAQVSQLQRIWRESRFRYEEADRALLDASAAALRDAGEPAGFLPALFCSPTMELGVDISALNTVLLRNVPPTPANYAQRAGRAGRSGQAASIITYCAAQSPHDQYFFHRRKDMVAGVVRPPALDIGNRELVTSHLHAVWLAETGLALPADIPELLELGGDRFPLKEPILEAIRKPGLQARAKARMARVLAQVLASLERTPLWMTDEDAFLEEVATGAAEAFDRAFDRWRELYNSARSQLIEANRQSQVAGLSAAERRKIKAAQAQATDQIGILEQGKAANGSDFYSYRYLATEGFLPGYNFPRLPLYAFVPGEGKSGSYLQRARFLAISEFGPRSLIYHEGRAFRVEKAKLPPETRSADGQELVTRDIWLCPACGAAHKEERESCHACGGLMGGVAPIRRTLRIDNVEAAPVERITANDEERVRQGFDVQTVFQWPIRHARLDVREATLSLGEDTLITLQYANGAEISRINKGLKRRKDQEVHGFFIDPRTGYWAKNPDEGETGGPDPDVTRPVRIVPIVEDRKNALLLRFARPETLETETVATVQHALLRGIEVAFQLEEGEILGEPLPRRDDRRTILLYEATEGGAGVLTQLIDDPGALRRVVAAALTLMHFSNAEVAIDGGDQSMLEVLPDEACVRGCYRCLLSYFNQPDHELIQRDSEEARQMLIDIGRATLALPRSTALSEGDGDRRGWLQAFASAGLPVPDDDGRTFGGRLFPFAWTSHQVAAGVGALADDEIASAEDRGWSIAALPDDPGAGAPAQLIALLGDAEG